MLRFGTWRLFNTKISDTRFSPRLLANLPASVVRWTECQASVFDALLPVSRAAPPDLLLQSFTGSGKTMAYLLPLIQNLLTDTTLYQNASGRASVVVVVPTRELAMQVGNVCETLTAGTEVESTVICGGTRMSTASAPILIGTPGAILNNLAHISSSSIDTVVVDEVDRLFDFGFIGQLERILRHASAGGSRRPALILASATIPPEVELICKRLLRKGFASVTVGGASHTSPPALTQSVLIYEPLHFQSTLERIISSSVTSGELGRGLIIFPTTRSLMFFYSVLKTRIAALDIPVEVHALHGRMGHDKRIDVSSQYLKSGSSCSILLATDVAARGLDFPDLSLVCQVGLSGVEDPLSQFVHRSGRTARAGHAGRNILLLGKGLDEDSESVKKIRASIYMDDIWLANDNVGRVEGFEPTPYQRHLSTKCLESLLSWYIERRSALGIRADADVHSAAGRALNVKGHIVKAVTDLVRSTGVPQPRVSSKLAEKLGIDQLPGLLISKRR